MPMKVSLLAPDHSHEGFHHVRAMVYNDGKAIPDERRSHPDWIDHYVGEVDGETVASCVILDLPTYYRGRIVKCGGFGAVGVLPHRRGGGLGQQFMAGVTRDLYDRGFDLASLYAFREPFYRKNGFEVCGQRVKVKVPASRFPKFQELLPVRTILASQFAQLEPCLDAFGARYNGMVARKPHNWAREIGKDGDYTIYAVGEPVEAFAVVSHKSSFWTDDDIAEFIWSTDAGYETMLSVFRQIAINKNSIAWFEPSDGPYYGRFHDQGVTYAIERPVMFRALNGANLARDAGVRFEVDDPLIPENSVIGSGETVRQTIQQFTQSVMGDPSVGFAGLPAQRVYCTEFF